MNPARTDWVDQRTRDLMADETAMPELFDDVREHGGVAWHGLLAYLRIWLTTGSLFVANNAADGATAIVSAFARLRAQREYDARPLSC